MRWPSPQRDRLCRQIGNNNTALSRTLLAMGYCEWHAAEELMTGSRFIPNPTPCGLNRREFLWQVGGGFAGLALVDLLSRSGFFETKAMAGPTLDPARPLAPKQGHFPAKAKHVIFLFMNGGPS